MKSLTVRLIIVAALAAGALGVSGPSQASPVTCRSDCTVKADTNVGYISPVIEVANGADVTWLPTTTSHPTAEFGTGEACFVVPVGPGVTSVPVVFSSSATGVVATVKGVSRQCASAKAISNQGWAVPYHCKLHFWMNGTVVVDR